jgi:hypothetical protein
MVELYLHSHILLHDEVLSQLGTGTTLPLLPEGFSTPLRAEG